MLKNKKLRLEVIQLYQQLDIKDDRVSDKELLVARSNKRCRKIYEQM